MQLDPFKGSRASIARARDAADTEVQIRLALMDLARGRDEVAGAPLNKLRPEAEDHVGRARLSTSSKHMLNRSGDSSKST